MLRYFEDRRLALQAELDAEKDPAERNRMGQFATPTGLAVEMLQYARQHWYETEAVRFIDPAIGTGAFYSALLNVFNTVRVDGAVGYEIDPHYAEPSADLWQGMDLEIRLEDFTRAEPSGDGDRFNLLVCNPPYVRHQHIPSSEKPRLKALIREACGVEVNGLAGLYCYFIGLCHRWMRDEGLAGWLIPSEFMDVNYGASVKSYLLDVVTLLHIHRFRPDDVQFGDALVSSCVVWFRKQPPPPGHKVRMTYDGSLQRPALERMVPVDTLRRDPKWTNYPKKETYQDKDTPRLSDFFHVKRGVATGNNRYFILSANEIKQRSLPSQAFRPILPGPRFLPTDEVSADAMGNPVLERRLFLLDCRLPHEEMNSLYPTLGQYIEEGQAQGVADRYLCRRREPWYAQEHRPAPPFLCTYLGRGDKKNGRPFRFILNHSLATAHNVYLLLYPKKAFERELSETPENKRVVWEFLNGICTEELLSEGRVYGGGLHKLEPKELGNVSAAALVEALPQLAWNGRLTLT